MQMCVCLREYLSVSARVCLVHLCACVCCVPNYLLTKISRHTYKKGVEVMLYILLFLNMRINDSHSHR